MVDATSVRVHQHAARAKKEGRSGGMDRSRGALTSKIHALADAAGCLVALKITEGGAQDGRAAAGMPGGLDDGLILLGDWTYDSDAPGWLIGRAFFQ